MPLLLEGPPGFNKGIIHGSEMAAMHFREDIAFHIIW